MRAPVHSGRGAMPSPNYRIIQWVGIVLTVFGFAVMGLGAWVVIDWRELAGLIAMPLGVVVIAYGIDVIAHPRSRRALSPREIADFILRLLHGIGPP